MAHDSDETLRRYIEKIIQLQQERQREELTEEDLRQIAFESGMTDDDLAYAEERLMEYLHRGEGFIRYGNWDGAIAELDQAMILAPANTTVLNALATAHWNRFRLGQDQADRDRATLYAGRVLGIDPRNDPALRLLSLIQKEERGEPSTASPAPSSGANPRPRKALAVAAAVGLFVAGMGVFLISNTTQQDEVAIITPQEAAPAVAAPSVPAAPPALPQPAEAPPETGYARLAGSFGEEGIGPGLLSDARSIATDGKGNIYVGEYSSGRVQMFDSAGAFVTQWNMGDDRLIKGMAADRNGVVYIAHSGGLYRYQGETGEALGQVKYSRGGAGCTDVTVAPDGGLVTSWDGHWRGGMLVDPKGKDDIVRFDRNGKVVRTIKSAISTASDEFEFGARVAIDGLGNIYALGSLNRSVFKFSSEGRFVTRFQGRGGKDGRFSSPDAIAVDGQGRVYVADIGGVDVFDPDGGYLGTIDVKGAASGLAFNGNGELLVVARTKVYRYAVPKSA